MSQYFFRFPTVPHTKPHQAMMSRNLLGGCYPIIPRYSATPAIPRHLDTKRP